MKPTENETVDVQNAGAKALGDEYADAVSSSQGLDDSKLARGELGGRLAGLSLPRLVYVLAVWPLLEQVMNFLLGTTDLALATRLESETTALAAADALGVGGYVGWLVGMFQGAVGVGAGALLARAIGGRHKGLANATLGQALLMALVVGTVMGTTIFFGVTAIGRMAGLNDMALDQLTIYLRILAISQPFSAVLFVGGACLRAAGDTRSPFSVMVIINVVNVAASVLFVWGPEPFGGHGVAGIAGGTALSWMMGSILIVAVLIGGRTRSVVTTVMAWLLGVAAFFLVYETTSWYTSRLPALIGGAGAAVAAGQLVTLLLRGEATIKLRLIRLRPHWHTTKRIVRVGIPNLAESIVVWGGNFLVLIIVGWIASRGLIGAHMIAIRIEAIGFLTGFGFATAAATLTGQYLGAGNPTKARQSTLLCAGMALGTMTLAGVLFLTIPYWLTSIISNQELHLNVVPELLFVCGWAQPFFAISIVMSSALRGAGDTRWVMTLSYASLLLVRLPAVVLFAVVLDWGLVGVWYALCGEWVFRSAIFAARFFHGGWQKAQV